MVSYAVVPSARLALEMMTAVNNGTNRVIFTIINVRVALLLNKPIMSLYHKRAEFVMVRFLALRELQFQEPRNIQTFPSQGRDRQCCC